VDENVTTDEEGQQGSESESKDNVTGETINIQDAQGTEAEVQSNDQVANVANTDEEEAQQQQGSVAAKFNERVSEFANTPQANSDDTSFENFATKLQNLKDEIQSQGEQSDNVVRDFETGNLVKELETNDQETDSEQQQSTNDVKEGNDDEDNDDDDNDDEDNDDDDNDDDDNDDDDNDDDDN
jgi:hypothetical protein